MATSLLVGTDEHVGEAAHAHCRHSTVSSHVGGIYVWGEGRHVENEDNFACRNSFYGGDAIFHGVAQGDRPNFWLAGCLDRDKHCGGGCERLAREALVRQT